MHRSGSLRSCSRQSPQSMTTYEPPTQMYGGSFGAGLRGTRSLGRELRCQDFEVAAAQDAGQQLGEALGRAAEAGHSHLRERLGQRLVVGRLSLVGDGEQ